MDKTKSCDIFNEPKTVDRWVPPVETADAVKHDFMSPSTCGCKSCREFRSGQIQSAVKIDRWVEPVEGAKHDEIAGGEDGDWVFNLLDILKRQKAFSEKTFGPGDRHESIIDHIRKELDEIKAAPGDVREWLDVVILALDGAWRTGSSLEFIVSALVGKQAENGKRQWPDWRTAEPGKAIEHIKSKNKSAFDSQVGGNYYKNYQIEPYRFFFENKLTHEKAAVIRRILRYDQPGGRGLEDLEKIQHECDMLKELNGYK